jgi:hypothetical protein
VTLEHSTGKALKLFLFMLQKRCSTCFRLFDKAGDGARWDMGEFAFDHWDPRGELDTRNEKFDVEARINIKNFVLTDDIRATTLKHRADACHHNGRRDFTKRRKL